MSARGQHAAQNFLDAWRRSRTATYVVDSTFVRTLPDGKDFQGGTNRIVQRPPDRLVSGLGAVEGRVGDHVVRCGTGPPGDNGANKCFQGPLSTTYDEDVDVEIQALRDIVDGDHPLYTVTDFGVAGRSRCFRLDRVLEFLSPPYGDQALFCFDTATGAPVVSVVERPEGTDRTLAIRPIRTEPTATDFQLPY
jgi:hypothetical protein